MSTSGNTHRTARTLHPPRAPRENQSLQPAPSPPPVAPSPSRGPARPRGQLRLWWTCRPRGSRRARGLSASSIGMVGEVELGRAPRRDDVASAAHHGSPFPALSRETLCRLELPKLPRRRRRARSIQNAERASLARPPSSAGCVRERSQRGPHGEVYDRRGHATNGADSGGSPV